MKDRTRVVWSSSAPPGMPNRFPSPARPSRARRLGRFVRISALLLVAGLMRRPRWRSVVAGGALTIAGLILRASPAGLLLLPGLLLLFSVPLMPGDLGEDRARHAQLRRELAVYATPAERRDLEATLDRYPDAATRELRMILAAQSLPGTEDRILGVGRYRA